ncbi:MAG TPA: putative toxin-antitoxin system toxin component, PIN family [Candidatus Acidoferrales bacterium]|nr:putative toxin-antitoxin system toxin component, PIN family [Candidatus Acidoferrales bacterium]
MRIVFDTNVLLRAHPRATGPARRAFLQAVDRGHVIISSFFILGELARVLKYPRVLRAFHLTAARADQFVAEVEELSKIVVPADVPGLRLRDETDRPVVGTAVGGNAEVLCTCDDDLFEPYVADFCAKQGIRILTDMGLLHDPRFGT